jgi:hypothetical protein
LEDDKAIGFEEFSAYQQGGRVIIDQEHGGRRPAAAMRRINHKRLHVEPVA